MHTHDEWNLLTLDLNCNSKGIHPSTPKHMGFETNSFSLKPLYVIKKFIINKVKLLTPV
jgi:hypothetical protein